MIREAQRSELPVLPELRLGSTIWRHPFIKSSCWRDCIPPVRGAYFASTQNWVWEEDSKLLGFVGIMESRFLAAMFVTPKAVRRGIGKTLMQYVQQRHPHLMLEVYQKNQPVIDFYYAQSFHVVGCARQNETQLPTWIMSWPVTQTLQVSVPGRCILPVMPTPYYPHSYSPAASWGSLWSAHSLCRFYKCRQRLNPDLAMRLHEYKSRQA